MNDIPSEWLVSDQDEEFLRNSCPNKYNNLTDEQLKSLVLWVDPLDGTTEYTQGFLERVTVLIGLSMDEEAIGGECLIGKIKKKSQRHLWHICNLTCRHHPSTILQT